ncbi:7012_t:CDS:2 [Funneliformis caledonium]|uniref:7012_t:CDS:1 n=1 Tax=Funneliformis caledonium TaxID=1117310 RepID=A0A9N9BWF1_9GLOM|nr:7012_t:CDS:2 [Funneliformis caledonium]
MDSRQDESNSPAECMYDDDTFFLEDFTDWLRLQIAQPSGITMSPNTDHLQETSNMTEYNYETAELSIIDVSTNTDRLHENSNMYDGPQYNYETAGPSGIAASTNMDRLQENSNMYDGPQYNYGTVGPSGIAASTNMDRIQENSNLHDGPQYNYGTAGPSGTVASTNMDRLQETFDMFDYRGPPNNHENYKQDAPSYSTQLDIQISTKYVNISQVEITAPYSMPDHPKIYDCNQAEKFGDFTEPYKRGRSQSGKSEKSNYERDVNEGGFNPVFLRIDQD